eukprot:CAMPEP_0201253112 /NCGR_PEP_ID=MMETSP0852-20130820/67275_1 /ASSEMBLY_ACC=CAM_ASM_000632 /TAXON_ID=183588 /ORGANISM="Pseudo-nitzschia fraudulenta, Strain WWA7" /LENGTH=152 /DNA_ID=CAMNT_0047552875 /DNA_START=74 /DNA_END=532 /DNA_ORIENTATION=-
MMNQFLALVSLLVAPAAVASAVDYDALNAAAEKNPAFRRSLQQKASFDFFDPDEDSCDNSANPTEDRPELSSCDFSRFPECGNNEDICYNRKPSRDHFHKDNHQHKFYIQYDRVFCYPTTWGGCSSCTPGRYCKSEKRCILEEVGYPCAQWF